MAPYNRRQFLIAASAASAVSMIGIGQGLATKSQTINQTINLRSRKTSFNLSGSGTNNIVSLADNAPPPVLELQQGVAATINLTNGIDDYTTMHWHGIRLPNNMDGVPYLTQFPIAKDETFQYRFTPPDAGTYWYHPHCMTMRQMAEGLTGILIVKESEDVGFDLDLPLNLKDFRLDKDGQLLPFFTAKGAARGGTLGNLKTTNWLQNPEYEVPTGGLVRLRIVVTDTTRIHKLIFPELEGKIIAWDGHPVDEEIPWPTETTPLMLAPGQRVDVALKLPNTENQHIAFKSQIGYKSFDIASLITVGPNLKRNMSDLRPLPKNPVAQFDLSNAETRKLIFGWSPDGKGANNGLCGTYDYTFWSIDRKAWAGDAASNNDPLIDLKMGNSYILRLQNESPNLHPIHLHGLAFKPIRSNLRKLPFNWTDTVLLLKNETIDIAFKADNPGDWAFHCHVIEHQKTGLAGYVRIS
ncbi:MAG: multicopper oxidase family protein [Alphaproteobacteria bacterium]|nr:multicopper oxidase family protein [Alphaproteobacteria bacterium]